MSYGSPSVRQGARAVEPAPAGATHLLVITGAPCAAVTEEKPMADNDDYYPEETP